MIIFVTSVRLTHVNKRELQYHFGLLLLSLEYFVEPKCVHKIYCFAQDYCIAADIYV